MHRPDDEFFPHNVVMDKVIVTTGGTGGHIFPALAVVEELRKLNPDIEILFVGGEYGQEKDLARENGIEFAALPARGFLGRGWKAFGASLLMARSFGRSLGIISGFRPQAIAGFGGYASFAPVLMGWIKGIPILLHEQNAIAGSSNKFLSRFAKKICVSFPHTKGLPENSIFTGNPVRGAISAVKNPEYRNTRRLLVLGGSQGAHSLNIAIMNMLETLRKENIELMHQTGTKDLPLVRDAYAKAGFDPECAQAFIDDMAYAYACSDLVLCRSGATTCAELSAAARPALLVPFPAAIHDHQTMNAKRLADNGAAILMPESSLTPEKLSEFIKDLFNQPETLANMARSARELAHPDAAAAIAQEIMGIAK